ncbi:hypothetical protein Cgig2_003361 [Carnegiea gigantea]|uniref:Uncharacterized protein n=1 Tax=Carnegiea gigantea TaxID=171969 RepID=A0A9Q1JW74_9CARY|nr:hypothetical protein Cgig2_003361 [Carnegiea gigantea]
MSEIPAPVCFGITLAPVEPTTHPPSHIETSHVSTASPSVPVATMVSPPFTPTLLSSTQAIPRYPFYFNNFPSPHNAHPSLPLNPTPSLSSLAASLNTPNITTLVIVRLSTPEDYLTGHTQFTAVLMSYGLLGLVDGSVTPPSMSIISATGEVQYNPEFQT